MMFPIDPSQPAKGYYYLSSPYAYYPSNSAYEGARDGITYPSIDGIRKLSLSPATFMKPGTTWVERGPDGRLYFVRKKLKLPSTCSLLADALTIRRRSLSLFRYPRNDFHLMPAPVRTPLSLPAPTTESFISRSTTSIMLPSEPGSMPYSVPCPALYALAPQILQGNGVPSGQQQMLSHNPQYPFAPPGTYPTAPAPHPHLAHQPLPPGATALNPPRPISADDLKYKCGVCGRFRSPRYHYKHPIPPGELPRKTVCRRCRDAGTDSEESHNSGGRTTRYSVNRSRSRSRFSDEVEVRVLSGRHRQPPKRRSSSRVRSIQRSLSRDRRILARSYYQSDSPDSELDRLEITEERRRARSRSPSVQMIERIRYIDDAPPHPHTREIVYVEERVPARRSSCYDEVHFDDDDLELPPRGHVMPRTVTSRPCVVPPQPPDRSMRAPSRIGRREYIDRHTRVLEETAEVIRPRRPPSRHPSRSLTIVSAIEQPSANRSDATESDESNHSTQEDRRRHYRGESRAPSRSRSARRRHRRRLSRHSDLDGGDILDAPPHRYTQAPSPPPPPPFGSSSLGYIHPYPDREERTALRSTQLEPLDHRGRPTMLARRRRSRSRDTLEPRRRPVLQPEDEVIEMERERPMATEDYDWYDRDGMRVRVREI